ncbi:MAG: RagB/SusD family nutrient uptake outer membrane protein [Paludibacter sp.]
MKKIEYILLALICLSWTSCNDYLDTNSASKFNEKTVYKSLSYTEDNMMGVYALVADANLYAQRVSMNWSTNSDIEYAGADETSYNQATNRGSSNYYGTPGNSLFVWTNIYKMIERANLCIEGINNSPVMQTADSTKMNKLLGEVLTMRAMGYYELVKHWGDVPFKEEPTNPDLSNVYLGKTDRDTIYTHMLNDLLKAEKSVPWVGEGSYTSERITKGFIKGLIARVCLSRGGYSLRDKPGYPMERGSNWEYYYALANQKCKEIIDNGKHKLNPSYLNVWKTVNALKLETSYNENMFEVALGLGQTGEIGYSIGVRFYTNTKYGYNNNANVVNTSAYYFYSFDKKDLRRDVTVAKESYSNSAGDLKEVFQTNPLSYNIAKWDQRWMNNSWLALNLAASQKFGYGINWVVMRYSDILLMYAETENELKGAPTDAAKSALKLVRARSFAAADQAEKVETFVNNLSGHDNFFNALVNERAWEFGGEAIRKFDLIRWNLLQSKIEDQRTAFANMMLGNPVTIFGNTYSNLPLNVYYKYASDAENINWADLNYYEDRPDLDLLTVDELTALGYTKVPWMAGFTDANKTAYNNRLKLFSSGLQQAYNGVCDNRYLYPISTTAISDSQGKLTNSYGY